MRTRSYTFNFNFIFAVLFVLLVAAFTALTGRLYKYAASQNKINEYNRKRFEEFYLTEPGYVDWVFAGSSHAYCTFDPANFDIYGIRSFQMGMPLQLPEATYYTLKEIYNYQKPKMVILDLYWYVLEQDFDINQTDMLFDVLENDELKAEYYRDAVPRGEKLKRMIEPVRYQAGFFAYANGKLENVLRYRFGLVRKPAHSEGSERYKGRGYVEYDYEITPDQYGRIASGPRIDMRGFKINEKQNMYLNKIAKLCGDNETELVLTTAPVSNAQFQTIDRYDVFHARLTEFAELYSLRYLDFNLVNSETGLFGDDCFFDAGHLNDRGVKLANMFFLNWISTN